MGKSSALLIASKSSPNEQHERYRPSLSTSGIFVGRDQEIALLRANLEDTITGCGRLILLIGEAGIGKTRTAHELATHALRRGARVITGRCYEGEGAPPFWPWVQIVRTYLHDCTRETLHAAMGTGAVDIAEVIPEIRERLPELPPSLPLTSEHDRFHFFDSFTKFLKNVAHRQPLVLILDDLHWADVSSLLLLQFLVQELNTVPLLVVGTYRDLALELHHPLRQTLGELARVQGSQTIVLRGLTKSDVAAFIHHTTGSSPDMNLLAAVYQQTEGNPFFLTEVVRLLINEGQQFHVSTSPSAPALPIPQRVYDVISRRLAALSEECLRTLQLASVIGRGFTLDVLIQASDLPRAHIFQALQEALIARLVASDQQKIGSYSFFHALVRETLYKELTLVQRVTFHRKVGEALENLSAASLSPSLTELAYHFSIAAQSGSDVEKAITYATQAGARATVAFAYEEAVNHYQDALRFLSLHESNDELHCELLLALGDTQRRAGQSMQARETLLAAANIARQLKHPQRLAQAALGFAALWIEIIDKTAIRLLEEALDAIDENDSTMRARLLSHLAAALYFTDARNRGLALSQCALEMARRLGDATTLAVALNARHWALLGHNNVQERLTVATEMVQLAEEAGARELVLMGRAWRIANLLHLEDIVAADTEFNIYVQLAAKLQQPFYQWRALIFQAMRAFLVGRFTESEDLAHQAVAIGQHLQPQGAMTIFGAQLFFLRQEQQRLQELAPMFESLVQQTPTVPVIRSALAVLYCELGRETDARREFAYLAADQFASLPHDATWASNICSLALVCSTLRDTQQARTLYEFLQPYAAQSIVVGQVSTIVHLGAATRYLGLLAATMGRWEEAEQHFMNALERNTRMGARPWVAYTQYEYAQMLLARDQPNDGEEGQTLLAAAFATAKELGMTRLEEKIQALEAKSQGSVETQKAPWANNKRPVVEKSRLPLSTSCSSLCSLFRYEGDYWTITYRETSFRLRHIRGLDYIAKLLRQPNREFHVLDLVSHGQHPTTSSAAIHDITYGDSSTYARPSDADVLLDAKSREAYKQRLAELREELEEARSFNDLGRADKAQQEIDILSSELARGFGLGGRARNVSSAAERARVNVVKGIKAALAKIAEHSPILEHHLATTIKTGGFCSYVPHPFDPISWEF